MKLLLVACALAWGSLVSPEALASDKMTEFRVIVSTDEARSGAVEREILNEMKSRIETRLEAGRIKHSIVSVADDNTVRVKLRKKRPASWYIALLASPGHFSIRAVRSGAINWPALNELITEDVEIRSEVDAAEETYLWSAERNSLTEIIKRVHLPGLITAVAPDSTGWRTHTLGQTIATRSDLLESNEQLSPLGVPFLTVKLSSSIAAELADARRSEVKQLGVVVDGEVVGLVSPGSLEGFKIELTAPHRASTRDDQRAWAAQIAGRLAASIPISIAVIEE